MHGILQTIMRHVEFMKPPAHPAALAERLLVLLFQQLLWIERHRSNSISGFVVAAAAKESDDDLRLKNGNSNDGAAIVSGSISGRCVLSLRRRLGVHCFEGRGKGWRCVGSWQPATSLRLN